CGALIFAQQPAPPQAGGGRGRGEGPGGGGGGAAAPRRLRVRRHGQRRTRALTRADTRTGVAQHESIGHALSVIERLGYETGMWDTFIRTDSNIIAAAPKKTDGCGARRRTRL